MFTKQEIDKMNVVTVIVSYHCEFYNLQFKLILHMYRVLGNCGPKVFAYCSQNMSVMDFLCPLGAPQMWSI